jgi:hypothetical protein
MGERAGYRIREDNVVSDICRKQWYLGGDKHSLEYLVTEVAKKVTGGGYGKVDAKIGGGMVALRDDLGLNRLFPALVKTICEGGFDSIEKDINCDISDHGLFEIEIKEWNVWMINHYGINWKNYKNYWKDYSIGDKTILGAAIFETGKSLSKGTRFEWINMDVDY